MVNVIPQVAHLLMANLSLERRKSRMLNKYLIIIKKSSLSGHTYMVDFKPLLFHVIVFCHCQLGVVLLHGQESTVWGAFGMFRPQQRN